MRSGASQKPIANIIVKTSRQTRYEERLAQRRYDRDRSWGARRQLDAGFPVLYDVDGQPVKEHLDGRRDVVRLIDEGQSEFERDVLRERTVAGMNVAKSRGSASAALRR